MLVSASAGMCKCGRVFWSVSKCKCWHVLEESANVEQ